MQNKTELVRPIAFRPVPLPTDRTMGGSTERQPIDRPPIDRPGLDRMTLDRSISVHSEGDHSTYSTVYIDKVNKNIKQN